MYYKIANKRASVADLMPAPWDFKSPNPPPYDEGKTAVSAHGNSASTNHAYISLYEGMSDKVRVSNAENPVFRLHGIIVDYDVKAPADPVAHILSKQPSEFKPAWFVRTASDQCRLHWHFEKPAMIVNKEHNDAFLRIAYKYMKLRSWVGGGFDEGAYNNPSLYYELGREWLPVDPDYVIPSAMVELWLVQAAKNIRFETQSALQYDVPIDVLAKEVEERFPGRWKGVFDIGKSGVRFWDSSADNETGCIVRPDGMQCFTGNQPFVSWRQLFGAPFVEQYESQNVAQITEISAYDGDAFWVDMHEKGWSRISKDDFRQKLLVMGYSTARKKDKASATDIIEINIKETRRVTRVLPFLYYPPGIITYKGQSYLNTSRVKCLPPAPPYTADPVAFSDGRVHFPFLYELLKTMFACDEVEGDQLTAFLAWLKYFYVNSYNMMPRPGHCIVLAGIHGAGKTMLGKQVLADLMGGEADGSSHLAEDSQWTSEIAHAPIMRVDDQIAASDYGQLRRFSSRIKKYVANSEVIFNDKFVKTGKIPWPGRIVVTCNTDSESLRILPNMDMSTMDKISLFRIADKKMVLPQWDEITRLTRRDLPNFARFLHDWRLPPEWAASEARFGVKVFHHPALLESSREEGVGQLLEVLVPYLTEWAAKHDGAKLWEGTATTLHADLNIRSPGAMREFTLRRMATELGVLARNGYPLCKFKSTDKLNIWRIGTNLYKPEQFLEEVTTDEP